MMIVGSFGRERKIENVVSLYAAKMSRAGEYR